MKAGSIACVVIVIAACGKHAKQTPSENGPAGSGSSSVARTQDAAAAAGVAPVTVDAQTGQTDTAPARKILERQLGMLPMLHDELAATFRSDALVLAPDPREAKDTSNELGTAIPRLFGQKTFKHAKFTTLNAGARPGMMWSGSVIEIGYTREEGTLLTRTLRSVELLDASTGKVAAATFGEIEKLHMALDVGELPKSTDPGPLTKLLVSPTAVAAALADDPNVVVFGTDPAEQAFGPEAAKKLLATWANLKLTLDKDKSYEVRTDAWGYAVANINMPSKEADSPYRMSALVIAVPDGAAWKVVALHYVPLL